MARVRRCCASNCTGAKWHSSSPVKHALPQSLVVLDELSEGTTFEEKMTLSEYILKGFHKLGASTLLVTHNHELCVRLQIDNIGRYLQVEFVPQGPAHRLIAGVSRVSHADRVASEIGFSKEDVEKHLATRDRKKIRRFQRRHELIYL